MSDDDVVELRRVSDDKPPYEPPVERCKYGYRKSGCELGHPGCICMDDFWRKQDAEVSE